MLNITIKAVQDGSLGAWALLVSNNDQEMINTGFIYSDEAYALRKLSKVLNLLTDENIEA